MKRENWADVSRRDGSQPADARAARSAHWPCALAACSPCRCSNKCKPRWRLFLSATGCDYYPCSYMPRNHFYLGCIIYASIIFVSGCIDPCAVHLFHFDYSTRISPSFFVSIVLRSYRFPFCLGCIAAYRHYFQLGCLVSALSLFNIFVTCMLPYLSISKSVLHAPPITSSVLSPHPPWLFHSNSLRYIFTTRVYCPRIYLGCIILITP